MSGYTGAVSGQRLGEHVPSATNRRATLSNESTHNSRGTVVNGVFVRESMKKGLQRVKQNLHC
jgi:hypothetical protein